MSKGSHTHVKLNNGTTIPILGFGTFLAKPGEVGDALKVAIKVGYRHIDCAACYGNEKEIGQTLSEIFKEGSVKRQDLFITSKLWVTNLYPHEVIPALQQTLSDLQLDYLDLYLVHIPVQVEKVDNKSQFRLGKGKGFGLQDTWRKMEEAYEKKLVRAIGVSNYPASLLGDILSYAKILPVTNQVERHPFFVQEKLVNLCKKYGIEITAYASLGAPAFERGQSVSVLDNEVIKEIAKVHNKTPAQVLIRWSIDTGCIAIPKSVKPDRIKENYDIWDFKLSEEEIKNINALDKNLRSFHQDWMDFPLFV